MKLIQISGTLKGKARSSISTGDWISCKAQITSHLVHDFAQLTGDVNPIHLNEGSGKSSIFGQRIAHGFLSASLIPTLFSLALPGSIYLSQNLQFENPVFYEDTVQAMIEVSRVRSFLGKNSETQLLVMCKTCVYADRDQQRILVIGGEAKVCV